MRTNIDIDENLLKSAMNITQLKTKKEVVTFALKELISKQKRQSILELKGKAKWEGNINEIRETK